MRHACTRVCILLLLRRALEPKGHCCGGLPERAVSRRLPQRPQGGAGIGPANSAVRCDVCTRWCGRGRAGSLVVLVSADAFQTLARQVLTDQQMRAAVKGIMVNPWTGAPSSCAGARRHSLQCMAPCVATGW